MEKLLARLRSNWATVPAGCHRLPGSEGEFISLSLSERNSFPEAVVVVCLDLDPGLKTP